MDLITLGGRLSDHRKSRDIKAPEMAERCGVSRAAYYTWEANTRRPTPENLATFCREIKLSDTDRLELFDLLAGEAPANAGPLSDPDEEAA